MASDPPSKRRPVLEDVKRRGGFILVAAVRLGFPIIVGSRVDGVAPYNKTPIDWQPSNGTPDAPTKEMRIEKSRALASFILTTLQTGNVVELSLKEEDFGQGDWTFPTTRSLIHPSAALALFGPWGVAAAAGAELANTIPQLGHTVPRHWNAGNPPVEGDGWRWEVPFNG